MFRIAGSDILTVHTGKKKKYEICQNKQILLSVWKRQKCYMGSIVLTSLCFVKDSNNQVCVCMQVCDSPSKAETGCLTFNAEN